MTMDRQDRTLDDLLARVARAAPGELDELTALVSELRERREQAVTIETARSDQAALMKLAHSQAIRTGKLDLALREITQTAAQILRVSRASVWRYDEDRSAIVCLDLYRTNEDVHERGVELGKADFPAYFEALRQERTIAAHDAHTDPRTAEFSASYLTPLGIESMLDAPLHVGDEMLGVLCNEHTGSKRRWSSTDELCASALADFAALAIHAQQHHETEAALRAAVEVAEQRLHTIENQRQAIAQLSAPIIDVWDGILVVPIVGLIDGEHSVELTERLLGRVAASGARSVIVDLTGVEVIDTMTADHLLQMLRSVKLLGAGSVLSGIRPSIAHTLVGLGVDLGEIATVRTLKEGLVLCLRGTR